MPGDALDMPDDFAAAASPLLTSHAAIETSDVGSTRLASYAHRPQFLRLPRSRD